MRAKKLVSLFVVIMLLFTFPLTASAAGDITEIKAFKDIDEGDGMYLNPQYRDNYYLDIEKLNILDVDIKTWNGLANVLFNIHKTISYFSVVLFYHGFTFDVAKLFGEEINSIQGALKTSIFDSLFMLAFCFSAVFIIKQLLKRNLQAMGGEILKVLCILFLSFAMTLNSSTFLTTVNEITKSATTQVLSGVSGQKISERMDSYAADACGVIWAGLVHKPWISLEFGTDYNPDKDILDNEVNSILSKKVDSEERAQLIEGLNKSKGLFGKSVGIWRTGYAIVLLIPTFIKSLLYIAMSFFLIIFQVITLFYMLLCPLVLLLSVVPALGGLDIISSWLKKILENQISVIVITFIVGLVISFDNLIYTSTTFGWLVGLFLQIFIIVGLILFRDKMFSFISKAGGTAMHTMQNVTRAIQSPAYAQAMLNRSGNVYKGMEKIAPYAGGAAQKIGHAGNMLGGAAAGYVHNKLASNVSFGKITPYKNSNTAETPEPPAPKLVIPASNTPHNQRMTRPKKNNVVNFNSIPRHVPEEHAAEALQAFAVNGNGEFPRPLTAIPNAKTYPEASAALTTANIYKPQNNNNETLQQPFSAIPKDNSNKQQAPKSSNTNKATANPKPGEPSALKNNSQNNSVLKSSMEASGYVPKNNNISATGKNRPLSTQRISAKDSKIKPPSTIVNPKTADFRQNKPMTRQAKEKL